MNKNGAQGKGRARGSYQHILDRGLKDPGQGKKLRSESCVNNLYNETLANYNPLPACYE